MKKKSIIALISVLTLMVIIYGISKETEVKEITAEMAVEMPEEIIMEEEKEEERLAETVVEAVPEEVVEEAPVLDEANSVEDEIGIVAIDPDTMPREGTETYREIRERMDGFYSQLIRAGYSSKEALSELEVMAEVSRTTIDELNSLTGYTAIGETKPAASKPSASTGGTTAPKPSTPSTPAPKPSTPEPSTPAPAPSKPAENLSEHGYPITENDTNGNGILDFLEDNYANTDGTVSSPEGTPNPFDMP